MNKREAQLRRRAAKIDCRIEKSRVKNTHSNNQAGYQLIDQSNTVRAGVDYELNLDALERQVARLETEAAQ